MALTETRRLVATTFVVTLAAGLAACGGGSTEGQGKGDTDPATCTPSGNLTVLTNRTDLAEDGTFDGYVMAFKEAYPEIDRVDVQAVTDYEGEVKTRMSTTDYGDVLLVPESVRPNQLEQFFEPLGDLAEMSEQYRWLDQKAFGGVAYGIPVFGGMNGIVYNKTVFDAAGVTDYPTTPDEFLADLEKVKAAFPDIDPVYTNYKDGWPLTGWGNYNGTVTGPDAEIRMTAVDDPWTAESDMGVIDGLLYDLVHSGLTEADPTTTNWEQSKQMLADGEIGAMFLGSWALPQMQAAAVAAGHEASEIAYMPFPYQVDGSFRAVSGPDYFQAINVNSGNKCAARAWIDWYNRESGFSESQAGLSPLVDGVVPASLEDFVSVVDLVTLNPAPQGQEALFGLIDTESGILTSSPDYRMKIVDDARSGARDKDQIFADLNAAWARGRAAADQG